MKRKRTTDGPVRRSKRIQEAHRVQSSSQSPLLLLPAELRNTIYEYALKEQDDIDITNQLRVPALMHTSRQTRLKTRPIWFKVNTFNITIHDLDARLCHAWVEFTRSLNEEKYPGLFTTPSHNWDNLLDWCERLHSGRSTLVLTKPARDRSLPAIVYAAHNKAQHYRDVGLSWAEWKEALNDFRLVLATYDSRWKEKDEE